MSSIKSIVFFLGGIPGSGKSTWRNRYLALDPATKVVSPDEYREYLTGDTSDFSKEGQVWDLVHQMMAYYIRTGKDFIFDATGANGVLRRKMLQFMKQVDRTPYSVYIFGVFFDVALSVAKARNAQRDRKIPENIIERMNASLWADPPRIEDGFNILSFFGDGNSEIRYDS